MIARVQVRFGPPAGTCRTYSATLVYAITQGAVVADQVRLGGIPDAIVASYWHTNEGLAHQC